MARRSTEGVTAGAPENFHQEED